MLANFKAWVKQPYSEDMDVFHWFLFLGLLIVLSAGWAVVLKHITAGVE